MILGKQKFLNRRAFSMLELLTATTLMAVLATIGVKNYKSQINKAYIAEAQQSLSFVYNYEQVFFNNWNSYHANLMIIGAVPSGVYNYDVGFTSPGPKIGGNLNEYPIKKILGVRGCSSFKEICNGECLTDSSSDISSYYGDYFNIPNCEVKDIGIKVCGNCGTATAKNTTFKAIAVKHFGKEIPDIWSINQNQTIEHENDGT
ncbi:MAG: type II secretion system protein [Bdellovibrionales bacterium]|nr:type II secretion system protein [Bdellovibrionales bacterium]